MIPPPEHPDRLEGWDAIAKFFGKHPRTVQRWRDERGMPIYKVGKGRRPKILANIRELMAWEKSQAEALSPAEPPLVRRVISAAADKCDQIVGTSASSIGLHNDAVLLVGVGLLAAGLFAIHAWVARPDVLLQRPDKLSARALTNRTTMQVLKFNIAPAALSLSPDGRCGYIVDPVRQGTVFVNAQAFTVDGTVREPGVSENPRIPPYRTKQYITEWARGALIVDTRPRGVEQPAGGAPSCCEIAPCGEGMYVVMGFARFTGLNLPAPARVMADPVPSLHPVSIDEKTNRLQVSYQRLEQAGRE